MWSPITRREIDDEILKSISILNSQKLEFWNEIKIKPEKWQEIECGEKGNGFWVVAIHRKHIIWYNDIEEGFNISKYVSNGIIDEYTCDQDDLWIAINKLLNLIIHLSV